MRERPTKEPERPCFESLPPLAEELVEYGIFVRISFQAVSVDPKSQTLHFVYCHLPKRSLSLCQCLDSCPLSDIELVERYGVRDIFPATVFTSRGSVDIGTGEEGFDRFRAVPLKLLRFLGKPQATGEAAGSGGVRARRRRSGGRRRARQPRRGPGRVDRRPPVQRRRTALSTGGIPRRDREWAVDREG